LYIPSSKITRIYSLVIINKSVICLVVLLKLHTTYSQIS